MAQTPWQVVVMYTGAAFMPSHVIKLNPLKTISYAIHSKAG
jgi:hypothetical protein